MASNVDGAKSLYEVPDACIVTALVLTSPKDACRVELASTWCRSLASTWCRSLASSDGVWEGFFPADYRDFLSRSPEGLDLLQSSMPKKELFLHLCDNPLLIDDGTKRFALDKASGKKNFMLSATALYIVWSDEPEYWKFIPPPPTSRFDSVVELVQVCWLEIHGVINSKMMSPNTMYTFNLVFKVAPNNFTWVNHPTEVSVGFSGHLCEKQFVDVDLDGYGVLISMWTTNHTGEEQVHPRAVEQRKDGWLEIELGEIYIEEGEDGDIVVMIAEVESNQWKSGLVIQGIDIRAKTE